MSSSLSSLIEEFIELKIQGEPESSSWSSIEQNAKRRELYQQSLQSLRNQIDAVASALLAASKAQPDDTSC